MLKRNREQKTCESSTIDRFCLVCCSPTNGGANLSIDVCRACTVFYRRLCKKRDRLICKTGLMQCDSRKKVGSFGCQKCRFEKFVLILRKCENNNMFEQASGRTVRADQSESRMESTMKRGVIVDLHRSYTLMCSIRRVSEFSTRTREADPLSIVVDGMVMVPITPISMDRNNRILLNSLFEFASNSFMEFKSLENSEQWLLINNFYPYFTVLDSEFRIMKLLPEKKTMSFTSYTTYLDHHTVSRFFPDTLDEKTRDDASRVMASHIDGEVRQMRAMMRKWNPTEQEMIAYLGIGFWTLDNTNASDEMHKLADEYRRKLINELDKLYRGTMRMKDYSSRMGEAMVFLTSIQDAFSSMRSKVGVLKLLDVIDEEMLVSQLHL